MAIHCPHGPSIRKSGKTRLTDTVMQSLAPIRAFKDRVGLVNSIDWDREGEHLIVSADDESVLLYAPASCNTYKVLHSKKCGADLVRFTNIDLKTCVYAYNHEGSYGVRIWDTIENILIGHIPLRFRVCRGTGISLHPKKPLVLVSCVDGTIYLFQLRNDTPLAKFESAHNHPLATFDTQGHSFACYKGLQKLHLYDNLNYSEGEFYTLDLHNILKPNEHLMSIVFSSDGETILSSTTLGQLFLIDAFNGILKQEYRFDPTTANPIPTKTCYPTFTPDSQYILCGGQDSNIHIWRADTGNKIKVLKGHITPPSFIQCNPKKAVLASGGLNIALWLPQITEG